MNAESVKARLKNFAMDTGHTFQEALTYYGLERTIYRISVSEYAEHFVLKGGIFLYAIFDRKFQKYHGLHISTVGYLDHTRIPVGIDIGFGDVIYPDAVKMDFPVILNMEPPRVNAYSLESSIAEKLEAIIRNGYLNSRYKDFYDIYVLSIKYSFFYDTLKNAVIETFENRKTTMSMDSVAFGDEFLNDPVHQTRWNSFLKKKKALIQISMNKTIERIKVFVHPLLDDDAAMNGANWNPGIGRWE